MPFFHPRQICTYLQDGLAKLSPFNDVNKEVDGGIQCQKAVTHVNDVLNGPRAFASSGSNMGGRTSAHFVNVRDDLEALAKDEDAHDSQQDDGQIDLVLMNGSRS